MACGRHRFLPHSSKKPLPITSSGKVEDVGFHVSAPGGTCSTGPIAEAREEQIVEGREFLFVEGVAAVSTTR